MVVLTEIYALARLRFIKHTDTTAGVYSIIESVLDIAGPYIPASPLLLYEGSTCIWLKCTFQAGVLGMWVPRLVTKL